MRAPLQIASNGIGTEKRDEERYHHTEVGWRRVEQAIGAEPIDTKGPYTEGGRNRLRISIGAECQFEHTGKGKDQQWNEPRRPGKSQPAQFPAYHCDQ